MSNGTQNALTRTELLRAAPVLGSVFLLSGAEAQAAPGKGPRRELKRWLKDQLATQKANERRTLRLRNRQEAVVRETHDVIQDEMSALKRKLSGDQEKAAADAAQEALHAQAKEVHEQTQQTIAEQLQMVRRQINTTERMLDEL